MALQSRVDELKGAVDGLGARVDGVDGRLDGAVAKTAIVRYDAYENSGGHQSASVALLDASTMMGETPYTLEVSSPGVDRPLTEPRHWRRAAGRLVRVKATGAGTVQGRVLAADADGVTLDVDGAEHRYGYGDLGAGAVQVEFGRLPEAELDELGAGCDGH